jgi:hypothetical protein
MAFEQAIIKVEKEKEFGDLRAALERIFRPQQVEQFLKRVQGEGVRIRDWDKLVSQRVFERVDDVLAKSGTGAKALYQALTVSDQAQMREFYLSRLEEVEPALRTKYKKIFQYY